MNELIFRGQNDQALTSSLLVAEKFGKRHGDVLRDIRNLVEGVSKIGDAPMFVENSLMKGSESTKAKFRSLKMTIIRFYGKIRKTLKAADRQMKRKKLGFYYRPEFTGRWKICFGIWRSKLGRK